jgi:hypothetical protein
MSEREKAYFFCLLFPLLWPLAFGLLLEDIFAGVASGFRYLRTRFRRKEGAK